MSVTDRTYVPLMRGVGIHQGMTSAVVRWPRTPEDVGSCERMPPITTSLEVLTTDQAAELLQVSTRTVLDLARSKRLPGQKVGRAWRFCRSDVLAYVRGEPTGSAS